MKYLFYIFKSKYCLAVFIISLILSYFLIPKTVFYKWYIILAATFMVLFSLTITCMVRNIKEKVMLAKTYKNSIVGIIAIALGLSALQVCGVGAPFCGAAVGLGLFSSIFPAAFMDVMAKYAASFIAFSIVLQLFALYFMNCFKKVKRLN